MRISTAQSLLELLWPEFVSEAGGVYLSKSKPSASELRDPNPNVEDASRNHVHILDHFDHDASSNEPPYWLREHPDFVEAAKLGRRLVEMWSAKLKQDFPTLDFRVYYCEHDNPIVRFHKVWPDHPNWMSAEQHPEWISNRTLVILDSRDQESITTG